MPALKWTQKESGQANGASSPRDGDLEVVVFHTTVNGTLEALKTAADLARGLSAGIRVLVPHVVPYALPIQHPQVSADFLERRFRTVADGSPVETRVDIRLCRDREDALKTGLAPHSLVVLGGCSPWWPSKEARLARHLRRLGHQVVFGPIG